MGILADILAQKRSELASLRARALPAPPARRPVALERSANGDKLSLITEIKLRAPSAGKLSRRSAISSSSSSGSAIASWSVTA